MVPKMLFPKVPDFIRQRCSERRKGLAGRTRKKFGSIDGQGWTALYKPLEITAAGAATRLTVKCTARRTNNSLANTPNTPGRREDVGLQASDAELYQSRLSAKNNHFIGARNANSARHTARASCTETERRTWFISEIEYVALEKEPGIIICTRRRVFHTTITERDAVATIEVTEIVDYTKGSCRS